MDHIRKSLLQDVKLIDIPLILDRRFLYDGLGFWDFPARKSVQISELWTPSDRSQLTGTEKRALLQNWLYFAFAHEVFGCILEDTPMPLETKHLISWEDESKPPIIDSKLLPSAIAAWMAVEEYSTTETQTIHAKKIKALAKEVRQVLEVILSAKERKEIDYLSDEKELSDGDLVIASICLLGEQIESAAGAIYGATNVLVLDRPWPMSEELKNILIKRSHLCEKEFDMVFRNGVVGYSVLFFTYLTSQFAWRRDHRSCSGSLCKVATRKIDSPAHVDSNCGCDSVFLSDTDRKLLLQLIRGGSFPMLQVEQESGGLSGVKMSLSEFKGTGEDALCIAISHVWSDMLGNPAANSMPACQLLKLQKQVVDAVQEYSVLWDVKPKTIGFWIDTICVPHDDDVKPLALAQMRDLYGNASGVLVLDSQIQNTSVDLGWGICLWQIYTSPWGRRLWTLQEGILNENTIFTFSDNFWTLEHLIHEFDFNSHYHNVTLDQYREFLLGHRDQDTLISSTVASNKGKANSMDPIYRIMRAYLKATRQIMKAPEHRFHLLLHELVWRTTSFPDDESICLGILLGVDIPELMKVPLEARLSKLVQSVGHCPTNLIFVPVPKMEIPGFRWLPKTFLNQGVNVLVSGTQLGTVTSEGLMVELPSFRQRGRKVTFMASDALSLSRQKMVLEVNGVEYQIISVGDGGDTFEAFFVGENGFDGVILLHHRAKEGIGHDVGCIAKIRKIENNVTFVTPIDNCIVRTKEAIYKMQEPSEYPGTVESEDPNKPAIHLMGAFIRSQAELIPSTMFCVG